MEKESKKNTYYDLAIWFVGDPKMTHLKLADFDNSHPVPDSMVVMAHDRKGQSYCINFRNAKYWTITEREANVE